jgi:predicted Fe-S protein YdhL (DUF1289 family)
MTDAEKKANLVAIGNTLAQAAIAMLQMSGGCVCVGCVGYALRYAHWLCMEDQDNDAVLLEAASVDQHAELLRKSIAGNITIGTPINEKPC